MKKNTVLIWVFLSFSFVPVMSQTKEEQQYKKESEQVRKQVWAWDKPQFRAKEVPTQYANASKVVLAHHTELTADSKSKIVFYGLGFGGKK